MNNTIELFNVIDWQSTKSHCTDSLCKHNPVNNYTSMTGLPTIITHNANKWIIEAAKETATRVQTQLEKLPVEIFYRLLDRTMDYYMADKDQYYFISGLTGNPIDFVSEGMEVINTWCRNIQPFYEHHTNHASVYIKNTAPVVVVLPSNSDQEVCYVLAQTLLSRNATIVRPSSQGSSAYATVEFVNAFNKAIDDENRPELLFLKGAYSVIHTDTNYLQSLAVDGWNYIFFGGDATISNIRQELNSYCQPRKIITFGTGLSTSVVLDDADLPNTVDKIIQSIIVNAGNECNSTDIIYVEESIYSTLVAKLNQAAAKIKVGNSLENGNMGCVAKVNYEFIQQQLVQIRGKHLNLCNTHVAPTIVDLHDYETTLEYPGPIASIRKFTSCNHLAHLISSDLRDNDKHRSLVTSVFTESNERFQSLLPHLKAYMIKHNKPTNNFNINKPHEGVLILVELVEKIWLD